MLLGRSFHSFGPHVEKDPSQNVLFILNGTDNLFLSAEDLNPVHLTGFSCSKSASKSFLSKPVWNCHTFSFGELISHKCSVSSAFFVALGLNKKHISNKIK